MGYRAKSISLAEELGLVGLVQNRPDGRVLVIAEGERKDLERFAAGLEIKNSAIDVRNIEIEYSNGSGEYSRFRRVSDPDEVGECLDDIIEILKAMAAILDSMNRTMDKRLKNQN